MEDAQLLEPPIAVLVEPSRPARRQPKLIAVLDRHRKITSAGIEPTMDAFVTAIGELSKRAAAARKQGVELPTFLAMLRDQAKR